MDQNRSSLAELILALQRNEVALWLGPKWRTPESESDQLLLAKQDWYGIWSNVDSNTAQRINELRPANLKYRSFVEVKNDLNDFLRPDFSFSNYCPFFHLNDSGKISANRQVLLRLQKVSQLERLDFATLLLAGFDLDTFADFLQNYSEFLTKIEYIFVTGTDDRDKWLTKIADIDITPLVSGKIKFIEASLPQILQKSSGTAQVGQHDLSTSIKAKRGHEYIGIPIDQFLKTSPPIDQYFHILTENDTRMPTQKENKQELLSKLLANQIPCWRAFAHRLQWPRPENNRIKQELDKKLKKIEGTRAVDIECLDIYGETCSGLSIILQWLAFNTAQEGYPTIFARDTFLSTDSNILLNFLSKLDYQLIEKGCSNIPVVIVLDRENFANDATGDMRRLPRLLKKEGRRVLLIRGMDGEHRIITNGNIDCDSGFALKSILNVEEVESLCNWAGQGGSIENAKQKTIKNWQQQDSGVPLLVALDYIITDGLCEVGNFSDQLTKRLRQELMDLFDATKNSAKDISGLMIRVEGELIPLTLGVNETSAMSPTKENVAEVLMAVVAMGKLKTMVPLSVLESLTNTDHRIIREVVKLLEKSRLIKVDLLEKDSRISSRSYYAGLESVGLLHDLYARLLQQSLVDRDIGGYLAISSSELCNTFAGILHNFEADTSYIEREKRVPILLLGPVFRALRAGNREHMQYAEQLSTRYLRISYDDDESSFKSKQLKREIDYIIDVYHKDVRKPMLDDSDVLLHSFALSCRWAIPLKGNRLNERSIDDCRKIYEEAEKALLLALSLVDKQVGSESPENLKTSLGLVYRNHAIIEINHQAGTKEQWQEYLLKAKGIFNEVLAQSQSTYVKHAIADLLIRELEIHFKMEGTDGYDDVLMERVDWFPKLKDTDIADKVREIIEMLSAEPDPHFETKWNTTKKRAFDILVSEDMDKVIESMKEDAEDETGYALDAMKKLKNFKGTITMVPHSPTDDKKEKEFIKQAIGILKTAEDKKIKSCPLGNLLRYALFSALQENDRKYKERYELIKKLELPDGKLAYNEPVWMYDYAMLAFQNGDAKKAQDVFNQLRKNGLFRKVSFERHQIWRKAPDYMDVIKGLLKITRLEQQQRLERGWGEFVSDDKKYSIPDAIPFRIQHFLAKERQNLKVGGKIRCIIKLQSSGLYAMPIED